MVTIVEFLNARYADIEQAALAASPGPWSPDADGNEVLAVDGITVAEGFALSGPQLRATVEHIALNDPAYVLADLAAKRQIVSVCEADLRQRGDGALEGQVDRPTWDILLALAEPFARHPDYDPAWAPS